MKLGLGFGGGGVGRLRESIVWWWWWWSWGRLCLWVKVVVGIEEPRNEELSIFLLFQIGRAHV